MTILPQKEFCAFNHSAVIAERRLYASSTRRFDIGNCAMRSSVVKRSIVVAGRKTSVSLEDAFWQTFKEIAGGQHLTLSELVAAIDSERQRGNLSSAIRLFVLDFYRDQVSEYETRDRTRELLGSATVPIAPKRGH
jgi:predicted DNA-binding ribbon-helix-helix protein